MWGTTIFVWGRECALPCLPIRYTMGVVGEFAHPTTIDTHHQTHHQLIIRRVRRRHLVTLPLSHLRAHFIRKTVISRATMHGLFACYIDQSRQSSSMATVSNKTDRFIGRIVFSFAISLLYKFTNLFTNYKGMPHPLPWELIKYVSINTRANFKASFR